MLKLVFATAVVLALPPQLVLQDPQPQGYAQRFFAVLSDTKAKEGHPDKVESVIRYYNYPDKQLLNQCSYNGVTSEALFRGNDIYIINLTAKQCVYLKSSIQIINPSWIVKGSQYKGIETVNGVPSYRWDKLDHYYYESVEDRKVTRVYAPFDQNGFSSQMDYIKYEPVESFAKSIFEVPEFCKDGQRKDLNDNQKAELFPCYYNQIGKFAV